MKARSALNAIIGIWFIVAPWVIGFTDETGALWSSIVLGAVQTIFAFWGCSKAGWSSFQNWITVITGAWFVIFPFIFSFTNEALWSSVILGLITITFSLWNMGSTSNENAVS